MCFVCAVPGRRVILPFLETREPPAPYTQYCLHRGPHAAQRDRWHPGFNIYSKRLKRELQQRINHPGVLATKVGYFGVKSAKVPPGADGHLSC